MTTIKPLKLGNKILLERAKEITDFNSSLLDSVIQNMQETMAEYKGVGLAAPQIGISQRIIMFGFGQSARYPNEKPVPFTVLINPEFKPLDQEMKEGWEGCLSVPGLRCLVSRYNNIEYSGYDWEKQKEVRFKAAGFHARIIQHEIDHLDGILFPFRTDNIRSLSFEDELDFMKS